MTDSEVVQKSTDGGVTFTPDLMLTDLVTNSGEYLFTEGAYTQVSSFGFDPECTWHIMVGTRQSGIIESFDNDTTNKLQKMTFSS